MTTITHMTKTWQTVLGSDANSIARSVGFIQREKKMTGSGYALTLMSDWLSDKSSSLATLTHAYVNSQRQPLSRQGLNSRFTARAAHFMECLLAQAVKKVLWRGVQSQTNAWFKSFTAVWVCDSTVIRLPDALAALSGKVEAKLPDWLARYVNWSGTTGNQAPLVFHQAAGLWLLATPVGCRLYGESPSGVRMYPNLYMMLVAGTTFYRKSTAYNSGKRVQRVLPCAICTVI